MIENIHFFSLYLLIYHIITSKNECMENRPLGIMSVEAGTLASPIHLEKA